MLYNQNKKIFIALLFCVICSALSFAQGGGRGEKLETMKIGFITQELQLSPQEAQGFWPVYNANQAKVKEIRSQMRDENLNDSSTDAEMEKAVAAFFDGEQRLLNLQKEYYAQLKKVLPLRKIIRLRRAEREFKRKLIDHAGGGEGAPPPPAPAMRPKWRR